MTTESEVRALITRGTVASIRGERREFLRGLSARDRIRFSAARDAYANARMLGITAGDATAEAFGVAAFIDQVMS